MKVNDCFHEMPPCQLTSRGKISSKSFPREDWGRLGNIREDSGNHHFPPLRILFGPRDESTTLGDFE